MSRASAKVNAVRGSSWRATLGVGIVIVLIASAAIGIPRTLNDLVDVHRRYAPLDRTAREQQAAAHEKFDVADWEFLHRGVRRDDTYFLVTPTGNTDRAVGRGFITRTFANYRLLPAVQVMDRRDASVIVFVDAAAPARASCSTVARTACVLRGRP